MNTKTLLGLGAIGGAIYLATSKKAQAKVKKTTGLSDRGGTKPLSKLDKKVIMAFIDKRSADNKKLHSSGKVLDGNWVGGNSIASWVNGKIRLHNSGSKTTDQIQRFIKKEAPKSEIEWTGLSDDREVADIILRQLGGNKFKAMTGAKNFTAGKNSLNFKLPANSTKKRINYVTIKLNGSDTYDMYFKKIPSMKAFSDGAEIKTIIEYKDVYFDQLQKLFTEATGLLTRL